MYSLGECLVLCSTRRSSITLTTFEFRHIPERLFGATNGTDYIEPGQIGAAENNYRDGDVYQDGILYHKAIYNGTFISVGIWAPNNETDAFNQYKWTARNVSNIMEFLIPEKSTSSWTS
jgi:hypothetical protein